MLLKDCCTIIAGQSPESKYYNTEGIGVPFFQGKADFGELYPRIRVYCSQPTKMAKKDDILLSVRAPVGATNLSPADVCIGRGLTAIRPKDNINLRFLLYYFRFFESQLQQKGTGTTFKAITQDIVKNLDIPVYPIPEQERIVARIEELFSQLDSGVETLKKTKEQLAVYRQAVLKEAFALKCGWSVKKAFEIGEINLGRQRSPQKISNNFPTKYIRAANITENGLSLDDLLEMEFTPSERQKYYLKENDILVSEASGSPTQVGKPAIWKNQIKDCCFQNTVIRHRVTSEHPEYIYWYYKYLYVSGFFSKIVGGVGINHLGAKNFSNIDIIIAPYDDQLRIVSEIESQLSVCDSIEKTVDVALQQAEAMRQSILKKAFEGRIT